MALPSSVVRSPSPRRRPSSAVTLAVTAAALVAGTVTPADATVVPYVVRHAGEDRFGTSAALSRVSWRLEDGSGAAAAVVLASAEDFPDGLTAAALAGQLEGPVLLVPRAGAVPPVVLDEVRRLGVRSAVVVGGVDAVGVDVTAQFAALGLTVERVSGSTRYDTAAALARRVVAGGVGTVGGLRTAFLATGRHHADALAASAPAFSGEHPVLLTERDRLSRATAELLQEGAVDQVVVLGGPAAVGEQVIEAVEALGVTTTRVAGSDRYATAARLAGLLTTSADFGYANTTVVVTTGLGFADSLSAGPYAGTWARRPVLFSEGDATVRYLQAHALAVEGLLVVGGPAAVPPARVDQLVAAVGDSPG